jgi:putative phosphoesterase
MDLAILSDTHDRRPILARALDLLRRRRIDTVLHCGDIESPEIVEMFRGLRAHFVFGNCDTDRAALADAITSGGLTLHEPFGHLEFGPTKIAFIHSDDKSLFRSIENSGAYDFLFYGHSHVRAEHRTGPTRVINPGALHRARPKTFAVLDLETGEVETVEVSSEPEA